MEFLRWKNHETGCTNFSAREGSCLVENEITDELMEELGEEQVLAWIVPRQTRVMSHRNRCYDPHEEVEPDTDVFVHFFFNVVEEGCDCASHSSPLGYLFVPPGREPPHACREYRAHEPVEDPIIARDGKVDRGALLVGNWSDVAFLGLEYSERTYDAHDPVEAGGPTLSVSPPRRGRQHPIHRRKAPAGRSPAPRRG